MTCSNEHTSSWSSQTYIGQKPAGNVELSAAILFTGLSPAPTLRMMRFMNLQVFSEQTYYKYQSTYLLPSVDTVCNVFTMRLFKLAVKMLAKDRRVFFRTTKDIIFYKP